MPLTREEARQIYRLGEEAVIDLLARSSEEIEFLHFRINQLENQLAKYSQNSHKPPSTDGFKKVKRTRSLRKKSGRKPGGQKGHKGHHLKRVEQPDHIEYCQAPDHCPCGRSLKHKQPERYERRQVYDLPEIEIKVTEYCAEIKRCDCGVLHAAPFPEGVDQPVQYGPRIKAKAVYLMNYQHLPYDRTSEAMEDLFNHRLSPGTLFNFNKSCHENLERTEENIKEQLISSSVIHNDETGLQVNNALFWMHTTGTDSWTHYACHPKRGKEAMDDIGILPFLKGTSQHDFWKSYLKYDHCKHALCGAHHLRDLEYIYERYEQPWAKAMKRLLCDIKAKVDAAKEQGDSLDQRTLSAFKRQYDKIIEDGYRANPPPEPKEQKRKRGRPKKGEPLNLLDRFRDHPAEVLAFMYDFRVSFDNNLAERDIRMVKLQQKISGTFRSVQGAQMFCRIRGYLSTVKKQNLNILQAIMSVFEGHPILVT